MLTERRKADRALMASQVAGLAREHGITAEVRAEQPGTRETSVILTAPHTLGLTVTFRGDSPHPEPDTYVLSWHTRPWTDEGKGWRLRPGFADADPRYGDKATDTTRGFAPLLALLARRFTAIANDTAFKREN